MSRPAVRRSLALALTAALVGLATGVPAAAAYAAEPPAVTVTVTPDQSTVAAPGDLTWTVRITNRTSRPLAHLLLAESVVLAGDPGHGGTEPFPGQACSAALGTRYCSLPTLAPGTTVSRRGSAHVPAQLTPNGPSPVDDWVVTHESVRTKSDAVVSNSAGLRIRIVRAGLPQTGTGTGSLAAVGVWCLVCGALCTALGTRAGASA